MLAVGGRVRWLSAGAAQSVPARPSQCRRGPVPARPSAGAAQCRRGPVPARPSAGAAQAGFKRGEVWTNVDQHPPAQNRNTKPPTIMTIGRTRADRYTLHCMSASSAPENALDTNERLCLDAILYLPPSYGGAGLHLLSL